MAAVTLPTTYYPLHEVWKPERPDLARYYTLLGQKKKAK